MEEPSLPTRCEDLRGALQRFFSAASAPAERYAVLARPDGGGANPYHISGVDIVLASSDCEAFLRMCLLHDIFPTDQAEYDRLLCQIEDLGYDEPCFEGLAAVLVEHYYNDRTGHLQTVHTLRLSALLEQAPRCGPAE